MALGLWLALAASIIIAYVVFHFARKLSALIFNGIFGLVVFWLFGYFGVLHVPLDFVTLIIAAIGGVLGVAIVVVFTALGVPL
ncbi:MAG: pro-sigmaK processing inhibitor BofA family protein [Candidatus Micrarchaeia archaeon]